MKLKEKQVSKIKELIAEGKLTQPEIAKKFKVSRSLVSDIATGRVHRDSDDCLPHKQAGGQHKPLADYDPTNERILELESEIVHLTDERNRERQRVKAGAKTAGLFKAIVTEMDRRIKPYTALPSVYEPKPRARIIEQCVMHISDAHADQVVRPEEVGGMEEYSFPIACARGEHYVDTVIDWTQKTLASQFSFPVLNILCYGDLTSGEIHKAAERSYYRNMFRNCLAIGQLFGLMYRDLAAHFEQVNVLCLSGNHGRRTPKKDYGGPTDNWDTLVAEVARLHCKEIPNVFFTIPDAWSANVLINNVGFSISHGDDSRSQFGIPFYGLARKQKGLIALGAAAGGIHPRYFCVGHHHALSTLSDMDGELLVNGAWLGTDSFAYNSLSGYREPAQLFHGVNEKYGVTWRLNVKLKREGESKGPKRYLIDGGREVGPVL